MNLLCVGRSLTLRFQSIDYSISSIKSADWTENWWRQQQRCRFFHQASSFTNRSSYGIGTGKRYGTHANGGNVNNSNCRTVWHSIIVLSQRHNRNWIFLLFCFSHIVPHSWIDQIDRQKQKQSPITEIIRNSLEKVGITFPEEKRRVSRLMLTDMNIAQLQVIVNEFHTQIERLNENLVQFLMERDDLHMSQDSMLVDIEDLTRYL